MMLASEVCYCETNIIGRELRAGDFGKSLGNGDEGLGRRALDRGNVRRMEIFWLRSGD